VLRGDQQGLAWLIERWSPLLSAQAAYRLGPLLRRDSDAEDVVAEAWLVFLNRMGELTPQVCGNGPRLLAFLSQTVLNIINRNLAKSIRRRGTPSPDAARERFSGEEASVTGVVTQAARGESWAAVLSALAKLSPEDREIVILRGVEGRTNVQAALELGEDPSTVSHRYQRALTKLRNLLPRSVFDEFSGD
jgi:RNA polymerase sigma factor (sigma-70 family)